jgi:hypothetical protein
MGNDIAGAVPPRPRQESQLRTNLVYFTELQRPPSASGPPALRYRAELKRCHDQPCPRTPRFQPRDVKNCLRFLKTAIATNDDFLPFAETEHGKTKEGPRECAEYAISFFDSMDAIKRKWSTLVEREDAESRYGTHVGEIDLTQADGLLGPVAAKSGHFALHAYESAPAFAPRVRNIARLHPQPRSKTLSTTSSHRSDLPGADDEGAGHVR